MQIHKTGSNDAEIKENKNVRIIIYVCKNIKMMVHKTLVRPILISDSGN